MPKQFTLNNKDHSYHKHSKVISIVTGIMTFLIFNLTLEQMQSELIPLMYIGLSLALSLIIYKLLAKAKFNLQFDEKRIYKVNIKTGKTKQINYNDLVKLTYKDPATNNNDFGYIQFKFKNDAFLTDPYDDEEKLVQFLLFLKTKNKHFTIAVEPKGGKAQNRIVRALLHEKYEY